MSTHVRIPWRLCGVGGLFGMSLAWMCGFTACHHEKVSPCHEMRKCITLTCHDRISDPKKWKECVTWCQETWRVPEGVHAHCARRIGSLCVRVAWEGEVCVSARQRCKTGQYLNAPSAC